MSIIGNNILAGASGSQGYEIDRSLRFNDGDSAYLNRTPSSAGNRKTWTWSGWVKRGNLNGVQQTLFSGGGTSPAYDAIRFDHLDRLQFYQQGTTTTNLVTTEKYRDLSAWYHVVLKLNSTSSEAAIFINGVEQTLTGTQPTNTDGNINSTVPHGVGATAVNAAFNLYMDGYMAEVNFVDGTALDASYFGETDPVTGAWIPKKYIGSYGTNGFYLNFSDNSGVTATTLGKDSSGNSNNWTPNNFSVTAGTGNDSMEDTPTNNFCTMNPLATGTDATLSNGSLDVAYGSSNTRTATIATFGMSSGKWYWEHTVTSSAHEILGIVNVSDDSRVSNYPGFSDNGWGIYADNGSIYHNASGTSYGSGFDDDDVIGCAFDADNGKLYFSKNGTFFNSGDPAAGTNAAVSSLASDTYYPAVGDGGGAATCSLSMNFGQRAFDYTPPTGFKALNTANLPAPTIKKGSEYFDSKLWTATGTDPLAITGLEFSPDLVWAKARNDSYNHVLVDQVRGVNKVLSTNLTNAESTVTTVTQFNSDGFNAGGTANNNFSLNCTVSAARTYVAWNWKADGSGSAIVDGSISSTVSVNADAGFSIVKYTGNSTLGATVGHGLGVAPKVIITKTSSTNLGNWGVYHYGIDPTSPEDYMVNLNLGNGRTNSNLWWNDTAPTSTVFTVGTSNDVNGSSDYIAYCFAEVEGYSKFGSYIGNGSSDGTFIFTGFRPAFFLLKDVDRSNTRWIIMDNARDPHNVAYHVLSPSGSQAEDTSESYWLADFVSNGVKLRYGADNEFNKSGDTYIYMAFAETPFKYANAR